MTCWGICFEEMLVNIFKLSNYHRQQSRASNCRFADSIVSPACSGVDPIRLTQKQLAQTIVGPHLDGTPITLPDPACIARWTEACDGFITFFFDESKSFSKRLLDSEMTGNKMLFKDASRFGRPTYQWTHHARPVTDVDTDLKNVQGVLKKHMGETRCWDIHSDHDQWHWWPVDGDNFLHRRKSAKALHQIDLADDLDGCQPVAARCQPVPAAAHFRSCFDSGPIVSVQDGTLQCGNRASPNAVKDIILKDYGGGPDIGKPLNTLMVASKVPTKGVFSRTTKGITLAMLFWHYRYKCTAMELYRVWIESRLIFRAKRARGGARVSKTSAHRTGPSNSWSALQAGKGPMRSSTARGVATASGVTTSQPVCRPVPTHKATASGVTASRFVRPKPKIRATIPTELLRPMKSKPLPPWGARQRSSFEAPLARGRVSAPSECVLLPRRPDAAPHSPPRPRSRTPLPRRRLGAAAFGAASNATGHAAVAGPTSKARSRSRSSYTYTYYEPSSLSDDSADGVVELPFDPYFYAEHSPGTPSL